MHEERLLREELLWKWNCSHTVDRQHKSYVSVQSLFPERQFYVFNKGSYCNLKAFNYNFAFDANGFVSSFIAQMLLELTFGNWLNNIQYTKYNPTTLRKLGTMFP